MIATAFDEDNMVLGKPETMTDDECTPLSVFVGHTPEGHPIVVSCWKPTREELEEITRTGRVWLMVFGGGMPPVAVLGNNPFAASGGG